MSPTLKKSFAALLLLALAGGGVYLGMQHDGPPPGFTSGNGRLEATEVDVSTKMAGRVAELLPHEGDAVDKNQIVAKLDMLDLQAQAGEAEAQAAQARASGGEARAAVARYEADLGLAKANYERTRQLVEKNFISAERLDRDRSAVQVAQSALASAKARIGEADAAVLAAQARVRRMDSLLADASLKAPVAGRVLYRLVEPGEVLGAGGKLLTLLDLSDVYMTIYLPTETVGKLALGDEARILLDALPDAIPAKIAFVADRAQFTPREVETRSEREKLMFRVKVKVDAAWLTANGAKVKPGMPGIAWVRLDKQQTWPDRLGQK